MTDQRIVIAQLNIQHLRKKLMAEQDAEKRATLQRLLAEEKVKLAALKKSPVSRIRTAMIRSRHAIPASASGGRRSASWFLRRSNCRGCGGREIPRRAPDRLCQTQPVQGHDQRVRWQSVAIPWRATLAAMTEAGGQDLTASGQDRPGSKNPRCFEPCLFCCIAHTRHLSCIKVKPSVNACKQFHRREQNGECLYRATSQGSPRGRSD